MRIDTFQSEIAEQGIILTHSAHLMISENVLYLMLTIEGLHGENLHIKAISSNPKYIAWIADNRWGIQRRFTEGFKSWFRSPDHTNGATKYYVELSKHIHEMYHDNK